MVMSELTVHDWIWAAIPAERLLLVAGMGQKA